MFTDQALEHQIKDLKKHGGMIGLMNDDDALDRSVTITPHLTKLVKDFLIGFPQTQRSADEKEHHQLTGNTAVRIMQQAVRIQDSIMRHNGSNPFIDASPLKTLTSAAVIPDNAKSDILAYSEQGQ